MKKILYFLFAFFAIFISSCTNDDIEIKSSVIVKVDPSGVVAPFTYENKPGELTSFPSGYKLRIRCLAYDSKGVLVAQDVQYLQNYERISTSKLMLGEGMYTIVAISDVVEMSASDVSNQWWKVSGFDKLATTKIEDAGMIGGKLKILGLDIMTYTIDAHDEAVFELYPQAIGALCLVEWYNIHTFSLTQEYTLEMSKTNGFVQFNEYRGYDFSFNNENGEFNSRLTYVDPTTETANNVYSYCFVLPMKNVKFRYTYINEGNQYSGSWLPEANLTLEAGKEYLFRLNLCNKQQDNFVTYLYGYLLNEKNNSKKYLLNSKLTESVYIKDFLH